MSLFWVLLALLFNTVGSVNWLPQAQYDALFDLYNATNGYEWTWSTNEFDGIPWSFTSGSDPCVDHWQGVNCTVSHVSDAYCISQLHLPNMNLRGILPDSLQNLVELRKLNFSENGILGEIPHTLCNLVDLEELTLRDNALSGPIPTCIGNLTNLLLLDLLRNCLTGPIPSSVGNLTALLQLSFGANRITGRLPVSVGNLAALRVLDLNINHLTGPFPSVVCVLSELLELLLGSNKLTGVLPSCLGDLNNLLVLDVRVNKFVGMFPAFLADITGLRRLSLGTNRLTGSLPESVGALKALRELDVSSNQFTGPIPSAVGDLVKLRILDLHNNSFDGSIPEALGSLSELIGFYAENNTLSGTLPGSICNLAVAQVFMLYNNKIGGTLPSCVTSLAELQVLDLHDNELIGALPQTLGNMGELRFLYLHSNCLTGTIPTSIGLLKQVRYVDLSNNRLTGSIPRTVVNLTELITLSLQNNGLGGQLASVFGAAQANLLSIQLDGNQFTGELPSEIFEVPFLVSLSIVGSCLHGSLPDNICTAQHLEALILYGLTTGKACRAQGIQALSPSRRYFGGKFPSCLLGMPRLVSMLLSSNGLTGSISSDALVGSKLLELDLCHNFLSGTIPNAIQNHSWSLLDLSHNKITGVLRADLIRPTNVTVPAPIINPHFNYTLDKGPTTHAASVVLSLDNNRLSGLVPDSLMPLHGISVLAGNLFACKYDKSNLPQHDSDITTYECASNTFDIAIYVWLGLVGAALTAVLFIWYLYQPPWVSCIQLPDELANKLGQFYALEKSYLVVHRTSWYCTGYCLVVLLPYYCIVSAYAGTHTHQYAYIVSGIYSSGVLPFAFDVLLIGVLLLALYFNPLWRASGLIKKAFDVASGNQMLWRRRYVWFLFAAANVTVVLGANIAFVYVVLYQNTQLQTVAQILLSLFKLGLSTVAAPYLIRKLNELYIMQNDEAPAESFFTLQLFVSLFNNIAIPCLVVAAIDPNCFSNILLPPNAETVQYILPECAVVGESCLVLSYQPNSLQFTPPYVYSYQCSASFITSYAPTFVYMSMSVVLLSPLSHYVLLKLYEHLPPHSTAHRLVSAALTRMLKPPDPQIPSPLQYRKRPVFRPVGILVTLLTQLGILLTFGVIFPPVALAMAVSITALVFMTRYKLLRFLHAAVNRELFAYLDIINAECERVGTREQMRTAVVIIICYCCAFYALFLFDTLGDAVGFYASVWVLFTVPLSPYVLFWCTDGYQRYTSRLNGEGSLSGEQNIELHHIVNFCNAQQTEKQGDKTDEIIVNVLHETTA